MRIGFIGDSFVNGTGDDQCLGWAGRVCSSARRRRHDVTLYNLGVRRNTSADIAARWRQEARERLPADMACGLVFSFGVNDCVCETPGTRRIAEADTLANARAILTEAKGWLPTLMVGPPPTSEPELNDRVGPLCKKLNVLCRELDVPYLPVFDTLAANAAWMHEVAAGDGAHPNAAGYEALAALVEAWEPWRSWLP